MHIKNINYSEVLIAVSCILLIASNTIAEENNGIKNQQPTKNHLNSYDLSTLDYHDINTILERGSSKEKQLILQYLINERNSPDKLELLISYYINNDRNDLAQHWIKWGEDNGIKIQSWQKLHLAIAKKDKKLIRHILKNEKNKLSKSMINDALTILNKDHKKQSNTHNLIHTGVFYEDYGALDIGSAYLTGEIRTDSYDISITGKKNTLNADDSGTYNKEQVEDELDLSVKATRHSDNNIFSISIGNNNRKSDDITYALLKYEYQYTNDIYGFVAIDYNEIAYTSPILRALGYKNQASVGLSFKPTDDYLVNINLNSHEYKTRQDDSIGNGYGIIASVNHILPFTSSYWDISIRTSVEDNNLKSSIPSYIATAQVDDPDDIVSDHYSFFGFGTVFKHGFLDNSYYLTNNILINAYTGYLFQGDSIDYGIDIKYGYAITPLSAVGFEAVYSNAFNSIEGNDYSKLILYYKHHF
jgi:hypothetical protein